jgi:peptide/nickel transport system substrate-binding protein
MQRRTTASAIVAGGAALLLTLTACSGGSQGEGETVSGGTFVQAISADPGSLNPVQAVDFSTFEVINMAYENLVYIDPEGELQPWLAESWESTGTEVTFTLKDDITCADGTPFTAETAARNIEYNLDPANATFYYGSQVLDGMTASAEGNTLTVTSATNNPFLVENIGTVVMVCDAGLDDMDALTDTTAGTGLFPLTSVETGTTYSFEKRDDYTWGPGDVTSDTEGLPDDVELRVLGDESTIANLLLSDEVNAAVVTGPERSRLDGAGLEFTGVRNPVGEIMFNERSERPTSDPLVREALVTALDRDEIGPVIAGGEALPSQSLVVRNPYLCVPDEPAWSLPDTSLERAGELLDEAGWTLNADGKREKDGQALTVKFIYDAPTATHAPAAELVAQTWDELGVTTELSANDGAAWSEQLYSTYDWDTGWVQVAPGGPAVLSLFFAGATPDAGGLNFGWVDNPEYNALVAEASQASPEEACGLYLDAEAELINRFDIFPLADNILPTYMNGATFDQPNFIMPTTIRMVG